MPRSASSWSENYGAANNPVKNSRILVGEIADPTKISIYWGYRVTRPKCTLANTIEMERFELRIGKFRYGTPLVEQEALNEEES